MRKLVSRQNDSTRLEALLMAGLITVVISLLLPAMQPTIRESAVPGVSVAKSRGHNLDRGKINPGRTYRM
jgi:hypothetical protein